MVWPHDVVNRQNELVPDATLRGEIFATDWRQAVEPASTFPSFFHPAAGDEISLFKTAEDWIERADAKLDTPFGARFDQLANFVAMARPRFDQGENKEFRAAFFELTIEHTARQYTSVKNMSIGLLLGRPKMPRANNSNCAVTAFIGNYKSKLAYYR
jgi:hypothetical protein